VGRERFAKLYKKKNLAHGVVCHSKEEWCIIKKVKVHTSTGSCRTISLKHGTEVVDGCWADVKQAVPKQVPSSDRDRLFEYINAWAWRARRQGQDLFPAMAMDLKKLK